MSTSGAVVAMPGARRSEGDVEPAVPAPAGLPGRARASHPGAPAPSGSGQRLEVGLRGVVDAHQAPHAGGRERAPQIAVEEVARRLRATAGAADDLRVERQPRTEVAAGFL